MNRQISYTESLVNAVRDALELDAKGFSMPTKPMRDALAALEVWE